MLGILLLLILIVSSEASMAPLSLYDDTWGIKDIIGFVVIFGYFAFDYIRKKFLKKMIRVKKQNSIMYKKEKY